MSYFFTFPSGDGLSGDTTAPVVPAGQSFTASDADPVGTVVGTVTATDNVGVTGFSIIAGNTGGAFVIDSAGEISVDAALTAGGYNLTVQASDAASNTGSETVAVTVSSGATPGFRSVSNPRTQYSSSLPWVPPTVVAPLPAAVAPTGSGVERTAANETEWNAIVAAAQPGDVLRLTATITSGISYRGSRFGISGGVGANGTAANPITITANPGVWLDGGHAAGGWFDEAGLDVQNCEHVHVIGVNIRDFRFGMRCQNVLGTAAAPVRVAHNTLQDLGDSGLNVAGWFQDVSSSGGSSPGAGNERGFSEYVIVEGNTISRMGRERTQFGEGFYLGTGSAPGWFSYAKHVAVRYNEVEEYTADGIDVKPGCQAVYIHDNYFHDGAGHFGACLGIHYIASGYPRPTWAQDQGSGERDPFIWVESNRIEDHDVTNPVTSSAPWPMYYGVAGIRAAFNMFWTWDTAHEASRLRCEEGQTDYGNTATSHFANNTMWSGDGFVNAGHSSGTPVSNPPTQLNNVVASGESGGQASATASDFSGTVPAVGAAGSANSGDGPGSGFQLDAGHSLGAGSNISALFFLFDEDIVGQPVNKAAPLPGAFQATA